MDITPIYELQNRLRSTAIAGVKLLCEDFRLKHAAESVKLLEEASPVFAKICQQMEKLLAPDCQNPSGTLLDTISLVDAVICTLGTVEVQKEMTILNKMTENDTNVILNISYTKQKKLLDALTTSGNGHFSYVCDTYENSPELFHDYRIRAAMVKALGASYTELAEQVEFWLKEADASILPSLMNGFDPKGKKEMVRRVRVIEKIAGADANDFYVKMLDSAENEVRQELLYALRFDKRNVGFVKELLKSAKGKNKQICMQVLIYLKDEEIYATLQKQAEKNPNEVLLLVKYSESTQAAKLVADILCKSIEDVLAIDAEKTPNKEKFSKIGLYRNALIASIGKNNPEIYQCYRTIFENRENFAKKDGSAATFYQVMKPVNRYCSYYFYHNSEQRGMEGKLATILQQSYLIYPNDELKSLIMELCEKDQTEHFLTAALMVQLLSEDVDKEWLDKNVPKILQDHKYTPIYEILFFFAWEDTEKSYVVKMTYNDNLSEVQNTYKRRIDFKARDKMTEILIAHADQDIDKVLSNWCGTYCDEEYCKRLREHFYKEALTTANASCINYLKKCGWTDYKGIVAKSLSRCNYMNTWVVFDYIRYLPCDYAQKVEELNAVSELVRSGKVIATNLDINELESMEKNL